MLDVEPSSDVTLALPHLTRAPCGARPTSTPFVLGTMMRFPAGPDSYEFGQFGAAGAGEANTRNETAAVKRAA
jgi:hypothetical protein